MGSDDGAVQPKIFFARVFPLLGKLDQPGTGKSPQVFILSCPGGGGVKG